MVAFYPHFVSCSDFATLKDVIGNFIAYLNTMIYPPTLST